MRHHGPPAAAAGLRRGAVADRRRLAGHSDLQRFREAGVALVAGLLVAFVLVSDDLRLLELLVACSAVLTACLVSPQLFLAAALLLLGLSSVLDHHAIHVGAATFYTTDVLVILAVVRALLPKDRLPATRAIGKVVAVSFGVWSLLLVIAGLRASNAGESFVSVVRSETALLYFPLLYFSLSRILGERALNVSRLWRLLAFVSVGFVVWMLVMRVLNLPFEGKVSTHLGAVTTSAGSVVRRDFGSATAFIIYPVLGLAGVSGMAYASRKRASAMLAFIGIVATLITLIRGEIFGLALGIVAILALRSRGSETTSRLRTAAVLASGCAVVLLSLAYINPGVRDAIVQRSLPGIATESKTAQQTAEYRMQALNLGFSVARKDPSGIGFRSDEVLMQMNIDPEYLGHSAPAWLLVFTGWPGLIASVMTLLALIGRSFRIPSEPAWLHPAFVGIVLLMVVYSFGANGPVGQPWVISLLAMVVALRFSLRRSST